LVALSFVFFKWAAQEEQRMSAEAKK
jgi:hypothetical protein